MTTFPAVTPTAMDFTAPEFPVRAQTSLSGVVTRRLFGNRGTTSSLSLSFDNISDSVAVLFMQAWIDAKGPLAVVTVPATVFDGAAPDLRSYLEAGGDALNWHFAEAPQLQRVVPGISSVRVRLEATRDA